MSDVLPNPTLEVHMFKWFIAHTECDMVQVRLPRKCNLLGANLGY